MTGTRAGPTESPTQRWTGLVNESYGLAWQANFASAHHKPIAFPEWGVVSYTLQPSAAGGDDPTFVQNMVSWFRTHNVSFENYFDADATSLGMSYGLTTGTGLFPKSAATYQQLYSATPTRPTPTPTPTPARAPTPDPSPSAGPVKPKSTASTKKVSTPRSDGGQARGSGAAGDQLSGAAPPDRSELRAYCARPGAGKRRPPPRAARLRRAKAARTVASAARTSSSRRSRGSRRGLAEAAVSAREPRAPSSGRSGGPPRPPHGHAHAPAGSMP